MERSLFHFELPEDLIAQRPLQGRRDSRLLVLDRFLEHLIFAINDFCGSGLARNRVREFDDDIRCVSHVIHHVIVGGVIVVSGHGAGVLQ